MKENCGRNPTVYRVGGDEFMIFYVGVDEGRIKKAIETMEDGVDMTDFISARLKLEDFQNGIELAKTRPEGFVKAVFTFD